MAIRPYHPTPALQRLTFQWPRSLGLGLILLLLVALPAIACGPPPAFMYGAKLLVIPAISILSNYGLPLVAIVGLESLILHKREELPYPKAIGVTITAQSFYLVTCFFMFSNWSAYPMPIIGGLLSGIMATRFVQRSGFWKNIPKRLFTVLLVLGFVGLDIGTLVFVDHLSSRPTLPLPYLYLCTSGILLIGFIAAVVTKAFVIHSQLKLKSATLLSTVFSMNVGSFAVAGSTLLISYLLGNAIV